MSDRYFAAVGVLLVIIGILARKRRAGPLIIVAGVVSIILAIVINPTTSLSVADTITWILDGGQPDDAGP